MAKLSDCSSLLQFALGFNFVASSIAAMSSRYKTEMIKIKRDEYGEDIKNINDDYIYRYQYTTNLGCRIIVDLKLWISFICFAGFLISWIGLTYAAIEPDFVLNNFLVFLFSFTWILLVSALLLIFEIFPQKIFKLIEKNKKSEATYNAEYDKKMMLICYETEKSLDEINSNMQKVNEINRLRRSGDNSSHKKAKDLLEELKAGQRPRD